MGTDAEEEKIKIDKDKSNKKNDKIYIPHMDLVDSLKGHIGEIFVMDQNKNLTFSVLS